MTTVYVCEKPSQARDIAAVLGVIRTSKHAIDTKKGTVTWAFGHLLEQAPPEAYSDDWRAWSLDTLPMLPTTWKYHPRKQVKSQLNAIKKLLQTASAVVIATDADREGEAIGRELLDYCRYRGTINRLWLSALDAQSIKKALSSMKPGQETEPLYQAALARQRADWLYGLNLTRAASLVYGSERQVLSVGRVQTPTLALVVTRDRIIKHFTARSYYELAAHIQTPSGGISLRHRRPSEPEDCRLYSRDSAQQLVDQLTGFQGTLCLDKTRKQSRPPDLFTLASLQKACNKQFGWPAAKTLEIAQSLYESHKVTSYPRTECKYLPDDQKSDAPRILEHLSNLKTFTAQLPLKEITWRSQVFNTHKVNQSAHHAIIPTLVSPREANLSRDERNAYELIARHYIACLSPDYVYDETTARLDANGTVFAAKTQTPVSWGWKSVFGDTDQARNPVFPTGLCHGETVHIQKIDLVECKTAPPAAYTEGTLIGDMERIAKYIEDPKLKARLKETTGIGTAATRAGIIEVLKKRNFLVVKGKTIQATPAGARLIEVLPTSLSSAGETAVWEERLDAVANCDLSIETFLADLSKQLTDQIQHIKAHPPAQAPSVTTITESVDPCPDCGSPMRRRTNKNTGEAFLGCSGYPGCKTTLSLDQKTAKKARRQSTQTSQQTTPTCPDCGSSLITRTGRKGPFLGCEAYPKCRHTSSLAS